MPGAGRGHARAGLRGVSVDPWRVVAAHDDIVTTLAGLAAGAPDAVEDLIVRRWDPARSRLETAAAWSRTSGVAAGTVRTSLPTPRAAELVRWGAEQRVSAWHDAAATGLARALADTITGGRALAAVPLPGRDGTLLGVLVVVAVGNARSEVTALAEVWAAPVAVALDNDARLHTLARLREAAEADRRALEARLGRHDPKESIVGAEQGLREVMARVGQVAPTDAPVLVFGETGSGKEVVARAIHTDDEDRDAIIVAVAACRGRIEGPFGVARRLGVNPHTLRARMRRLGIDWARYRGS